MPLCDDCSVRREIAKNPRWVGEISQTKLGRERADKGDDI